LETKEEESERSFTSTQIKGIDRALLFILLLSFSLWMFFSLSWLNCCDRNPEQTHPSFSADKDRFETKKEKAERSFTSKKSTELLFILSLSLWMFFSGSSMNCILNRYPSFRARSQN
jgi:hypothetical protein